MPRRPSPDSGSVAAPARKPRRAAAAPKSPTRRRPPRYEDDGLSGLILRLPWWGHLLLAAAMWPLCTEALPRLPAHEPWQQTLLREWVPQIWPLATAGFALLAGLSFVRALRRAARPSKSGRRKS